MAALSYLSSSWGGRKISGFDFSVSEESDGTKRLFDLVDMLMTDRPDMQIMFTTHEDTIMDQELFRRDEIWFIERNVDNASQNHSLDRFKERYDKKLSKAYLEGRYGAIPAFDRYAEAAQYSSVD